MAKERAFSLYDVEQFLKDAGAERIHEKAVVSLEQELENTVKELVSGAKLYANYAGRKKLIKHSDIRLVKKIGISRGDIVVSSQPTAKRAARTRIFGPKTINYSVETEQLY